MWSFARRSSEDRTVEVRRLLRDVDASGLHHQDRGSLPREKPQVPYENCDLVPLGNILVEKIDAPDGLRVRLGSPGVREDRQEIRPPLYAG